MTQECRSTRSADESGGSDELDINEGWESDTSGTSDDSDASDDSDSDESDTGDRDTSDTRGESDASTASNSREELANSESCAVAGPATTPLPTCPAAAHPDDRHLDLHCQPPVQDLRENEAYADADADADDAAQRSWHVQEGSDDRLSNTSTSGGDQERDDDKMIATQIEAELTYLRKQRQMYGRHELRLTCVGPSKAGKTALMVSSQAALHDEEVILPAHLGVGNHHGVCQDSYTTSLLGAELRVVSQDVEGITYDYHTIVPRTMEEIAELFGVVTQDLRKLAVIAVMVLLTLVVGVSFAPALM